MTTDVKSLFDIMSLRLRMYDEGTIHPDKVVSDATRELVHKLGRLEPTEGIDVRILSADPIHAQYIRTRTGEVLAEINAKQNV
jgi:hypothetical protein